MVDVRAEKARTKYKLAQVLKEIDPDASGNWQQLKSEAQVIRQELVGKQAEEDDNEESYETLITYFLR